MNPFVPVFEGELRLQPVPDDFVARIRRRVEQGLLMPGRRSRANYAVRSSSHDEIAFGAEDLLTAYNVGLNEVRVRRESREGLRYWVSFWRWTWTAVIHSGLISLLLAGTYFVLPEMRRDVARYAYGPYLFWGIVVLGMFWPWLLTAVHRKFAEKALQRILRESLT